MFWHWNLSSVAGDLTRRWRFNAGRFWKRDTHTEPLFPRDALVADLKKLVWFREEARYFGDIRLIFGENQALNADLIRNLQDAAEAAHVDLTELTILRHLAVGTRAVTL